MMMHHCYPKDLRQCRQVLKLTLPRLLKRLAVARNVHDRLISIRPLLLLLLLLPLLRHRSIQVQTRTTMQLQ
jgi:hypothetical protein